MSEEAVQIENAVNTEAKSTSVKSEKNFSEPTVSPLTERKKRAEKIAKTRKKNPNFPYTKTPKIPKAPKILDSHRQVFELYKDQGFRSLGKAIRRTGVYSEGVAKRVGQITKSKSWQLLMQEYLPESTIALRHAELLDKRDWRKVEEKDPETGQIKTHFVDDGPETLAVSKGLELAYRLRGAFSKEEKPPPSTVMYNLFYKPEVREQVKAFEDNLKLTLLNEINKKNSSDIDANEIGEDEADGGGSSPVKEGISGSKNL